MPIKEVYKTLLASGTNSSIYKIASSNNIIKVFSCKEAAIKEVKFLQFMRGKNMKCALIPDYVDENFNMTMKMMTPLSLIPFDSLSIKHQKKVIYNIVHCLYELHVNNIVHNDLKPDNILYDPITLDIKLIDFSSSFFEGFSINNATTVKYNSPEIIKSKKSDIWSLGIILNDLLKNCNILYNYKLVINECLEINMYNRINTCRLLDKIKKINNQ